MFLLLAILFNAYLGIVFVYFDKYKVDIFQAIVFNYWTCVITGSLVLGNFPIHSSSVQTDWFKMAIVMGILFISVFNLIGISSVKVGATVTQTANRLSLVIPVMLSFFLYHEDVSALKVIGILLALTAVVLTSIQKNKSTTTEKKASVSGWQIALPLILFISSGIIDSLTKYVQRTHITNETIANAYLIAGFMVAAIIGTAVLLSMYITRKKQFIVKHLFAGVILGIPNYFSIYFLIKALQNPAMNSSATIPINNIGVLFVVSMFGIFIFKEKLSKQNYIGLVLSLLAIICIYLGDKA